MRKVNSVIICTLLCVVSYIDGQDLPHGLDLLQEQLCRSGSHLRTFDCTLSSCHCSCHGFEIHVNCSFLNLTRIPSDIPKDTVSLDLSHNKIFEINSSSFTGLSKLKNLDLSFNNINDSAAGCLSYLTSLAVLNISMNRDLGFSNFRNITHRLNNTRIQELRASFIRDPERYTSVLLQSDDLMGISTTQLKVLFLDGNQIQCPKSSVADFLPSTLESLSIQQNVLGNYKMKEVFNFAMNHPKLSSIDISYQCDDSRLEKLKLKDLKLSTYFNSNTHRRKRYINEINNSNHSRTKECMNTHSTEIHNSALKKIIAKDASFFECVGELHFGRIELEHIDLSRNKIRSLNGPVTAHPPHKIKHVDLSDNDCEYINESFFTNITSVEILLLAGNFLGPSLSRPVSSFWPLTKLKKLDVSRNRLGAVSERLLDNQLSLTHLNLSCNNLKIFNISMDRLISLRSIDLSYNQISYLRKNEMRMLDRNAEKLQRNVTLDLSHNPLLCTCNQVDFWKWARSTKVVIKIAHYEVCTLDNGTLLDLISFQNEKVIHDMEEMCRSSYVLYITMPFLCLVVILLFGAVVYKKRWEITYKWYIYRLRRKGYSPIKGYNMGYDFDAFVSYNERDAKFVKQVLIKKLEDEYGCHLCLHERDFCPGQRIASNIISAIHHSSKTLVILSRAYLKSKWCRYELHMATEEEHHAGRKAVVILVLDEIPKTELPVEILEHFCKNTYIRLPNKDNNMETFWDVVRVSLSRDVDT